MGDGGIVEGVVWEGVCMWCVGEGRLDGGSEEGVVVCEGVRRQGTAWRDGFVCIDGARRRDGVWKVCVRWCVMVVCKKECVGWGRLLCR